MSNIGAGHAQEKLGAHEVAAFPDSVNVGFAERIARDRFRLRVFERGVGETLACGSGACAAAAILMAGPATFVFEGEWLP